MMSCLKKGPLRNRNHFKGFISWFKHQTMIKIDPSIETRIKHVLYREFNINSHYLSAHSSFKEDLGFDQYDMIFLSIAIEEEFGILFSEQFSSVEVIRDLIPFIISCQELE